METRLLGKTGLYVSALGFGAMELGKLDFAQAEKLLNTALDQGITFIDSSPCYGIAEEYVGRAIAHRRREYVLATKCGCHVDHEGKFTLGADHVWTREQILHNIDRSLQLLTTDHIDVWQLHGIMPEFLQGGRDGEVMRAVEDVQKSGRVLHVAFSCRNGGPGQDMYPALFGYHACKSFFPWNKFAAVQLIYGTLVRTNEQVIDAAAELNMGVICRGVVKKYFDTYDQLFEDAGLYALLESGEDRITFLIRFALTHQNISTIIIGTKDENHLMHNVMAANKGPLSPAVYAEAKKRLDGIGVTAKAW